MKSWLKENWFKAGLLAATLTAGLSVAYYFVFSLPEKKDQDFLFSMKQKCQSIGAKLYEEDVKEMGNNNLFVPEYTYNQKLNTCLYAGGYVQEDSLQKWVKDVYSNKAIFNFISAKGKSFENTRFCDTCISNEEFERRKKELFR